MTQMLKIGFGLIFLFQTLEYNFNYKLTYEVINLKNQKKNQTVTYFINEQDNSYNSVMGTRGQITFVDQNGVYWKGQINNLNLANSEIMLEKELVRKYSNPYKFQVDNYDFVELKDTLLNTKKCKRYMLRSNDLEREQKKKLAREIYVIDTSSNREPLLTFSTAYEIWKKRKNIPNGILIEKYLYNSKGEMVTKEKLKSTESISLKFIIASE